MLGLTPADVMAAPLEAIARIHPDDRAPAARGDGARRAGSRRGRVTLRWCHPDGRIVWAEHRHLPVFDADGNLIAIDGIARDVTRQRELEQERDAQIAMLDGLIAHMSDGVFAETGDDQVAVVNAAFTRIFDLPPAPWPARRARRCSGSWPASDSRQPGECCPPADGGELLPAGELRLKDGRILEQQHFSVPLRRPPGDSRLAVPRHHAPQEGRGRTAHVAASAAQPVGPSRGRPRRRAARPRAHPARRSRTAPHRHPARGHRRGRAVPPGWARRRRSRSSIGCRRRSASIDLSVATVQRVATRAPSADPGSSRAGVGDSLGSRGLPAPHRHPLPRLGRHAADRRAAATTTVLHRILLEALTNVARHANAGTVWIFFRQRRDRVIMEVRDNGKGIPDDALTSPAADGAARDAGAGARRRRRAPDQPAPRRRHQRRRHPAVGRRRSSAHRSRPMSRILIVDDHPVVREGIGRVLTDAHPRRRRVGSADGAAQAAAMMQQGAVGPGAARSHARRRRRDGGAAAAASFASRRADRDHQHAPGRTVRAARAPGRRRRLHLEGQQSGRPGAGGAGRR